jgi:uncharacterized membrane protein YdjX (TVP38/TMEM64 family)
VGEGSGDPAGKRRDRSPLLRYLPLVVLAAATAAVFATGAHRSLKLENLIAHRDQIQSFVAMHEAKALAVFVLAYIASVALSIPGAVFLTVFGGFIFGWLLGGIAAVVAATIGAIIVFLIAQTSLGDTLGRKAGPRLERLACGFREDAFSYLLFLRLVPIFPFWLVNLAPALFAVPLRTFALATVIGILPGTFAFAFAGAGLDSVIAAQKAAKQACLAAGGTDCYMKIDLHALVTPKLLIAFAALGCVALIPVLVRRWFGRRARAFEETGLAEGKARE